MKIGEWADNFITNAVAFRDLPDAYSLTEQRLPVLLTGSGPSLMDSAGVVDKWPGPVVCGVSELAFFDMLGAKPDVCVVVDADEKIWEKARVYERQEEVNLVVHPAVHPGLLEWKGPVLRYFLHGGRGEFTDHYNLFYGTSERMVRVYGGGCVANVAMALCVQWQLDPIYLAGVDFAFVDDKSRWDRDGLPDSYFVHPSGFKADWLNIIYRNNLEAALGDPQSLIGDATIISLSRGMTQDLGLPHMKPEEGYAKACDRVVGEEKSEF